MVKVISLHVIAVLSKFCEEVAFLDFFFVKFSMLKIFFFSIVVDNVFLHV